MSGFSRGVVWFNRLLLLAATFIMTMIAVRTLRDPVGSTLPMGIVLTSATAATVVRVGFGGFPLGFAVALIGCLMSTKRLLGGLSLLASIAGAATLTRLLGIVLDGATPYNLLLLRPEIALCILSAVGIVLERRRLRREPAGPTLGSRPVLRGSRFLSAHRDARSCTEHAHGGCRGLSSRRKTGAAAGRAAPLSGSGHQ